MNSINGFTYKELFLLAIEKPVMAQLEVTRNCNQRCFFCFRRCSPEKKFSNLSLKKWKLIILKLVSIGIREINFSGGEIFLFKNIDKLFHYAKSVGIKKIVVNTNGLVNLAKHDLSLIDILIFSIHDLQKNHDKITGIRGSFSLVNKAITYAINKRYRVGINTVVCRKNVANLDKIYAHFKKLPLVFHSFNLSINRDSIEDNVSEFELIFLQYLKFLEKIPERRRKLRHGMQNIFVKDKKFFKSPIPLPHCAGGKYKLVIDYQGNVYPCRYFQESKYFCGNILKSNPKTIWKKGKGFKLFRSIIVDKNLPHTCQSCFKKEKCLGGCLAWRIYTKNNKSYEKDIRCDLGNAYIRG